MWNKAKGNSSTETEAVLIVKQDAEKVLREIAGLYSIGDYLLKPKAIRNIHDTYFDSKDGLLRRRSISLRIREIDGVSIISVKSNPRTTSGGLISRGEIELPWSNEAIRRIADQLRLALDQAGMSDSYTSPRDTLTRMGLRVIQDRQTTREARDIVAASGSQGPVLAELALDAVTYHLQHHFVSLFEVEVEAKTNDSTVIRNVTHDLLRSYEPKLQKWEYGKFVTGEAIRTLAQSGKLNNYLDRNRLTLPGFELIERFIHSNYS